MSYFKDLLTDECFKSGFFLQGPNPVTDQRKVFSYLDYGGEAIKVNDVLWIMSQWWTPYDIKDASFSKKADGVYEYFNQSRRCLIDTKEGRFRFVLDSSAEYKQRLGGPRNDPSTPWSHFLLEQDFVQSVRIRDLSALFASVKVRINDVKNLDGDSFDPNKHTAQFIWYLTIREGNGKSKEGLGGNFIWFGIPIYDYRYPSIPKHIQYDGDFAGSTKALIYCLNSKDYLSDAPLKPGKEYDISLDILPAIKRAVKYAVKNKIFTTSRNLVVNYMNIGWELPGSFAVDSEISNIRLKGVLND